jgi:hypothetical protein
MCYRVRNLREPGDRKATLDDQPGPELNARAMEPSVAVGKGRVKPRTPQPDLYGRAKVQRYRLQYQC